MDRYNMTNKILNNAQPAKLVILEYVAGFDRIVFRHNTPLDADVSNVIAWVKEHGTDNYTATEQMVAYTGDNFFTLTGLTEGTRYSVRLSFVDQFVSSSPTLISAQYLEEETVLSLSDEVSITISEVPVISFISGGQDTSIIGSMVPMVFGIENTNLISSINIESSLESDPTVWSSIYRGEAATGIPLTIRADSYFFRITGYIGNIASSVTVFDTETATIITENPVANATRYYIKYPEGAVISAPGTTLNFYTHKVENGVDSVVTSGTNPQLYVNDSARGIETSFTNSTLTTASKVELRNSNGDVLDSLSAINLTVSSNGNDAIAGTVDVTGTLAWTKAANNGNWSPVATTTDLTFSFYQSGSLLAQSDPITVTLNQTDGSISTSQSTYTKGSGVSQTTVTVTGRNSPNITFSSVHVNSGIKVHERIITSIGGAKGADGADGRSIANVTKSGETVTIQYDDGSSDDTFTVDNGIDADPLEVDTVTKAGLNTTITFTDGTQFVIGDGQAGRGINTVNRTGETVTVSFDDGSVAQTFEVADGADGADGRSIANVTKSGETVTIQYDDGSSDDTFTVDNGIDADPLEVDTVTKAGLNTTITFTDGTQFVIGDGRGIDTVTKSGETVTVSFDDGSVDQTFEVADGPDAPTVLLNAYVSDSLPVEAEESEGRKYYFQGDGYSGVGIIKILGIDFENGARASLNGNFLGTMGAADQVTSWFSFEGDILEGLNTISIWSSNGDGGTILRVNATIAPKGAAAPEKFSWTVYSDSKTSGSIYTTNSGNRTFTGVSHNRNSSSPDTSSHNFYNWYLSLDVIDLTNDSYLFGKLGASQINVDEVFAEDITATGSVTIGTPELGTGTVGATRSVILSADPDDSPIHVRGSDGTDMLRFITKSINGNLLDFLQLGGGLAPSTITSLGVFSPEVLSALIPEVAGATGGTVLLPNMPVSASSSNTKEFEIEINPSNDGNALVSVSLINSYSVPATNSYNHPHFRMTLSRSTNGGSNWTVLTQAEKVGSFHAGTAEDYSGSASLLLEYLDEDLTATPGQIKYSVLMQLLSGIMPSDNRITDFTASQPMQGGGAAGAATTLGGFDSDYHLTYENFIGVFPKDSDKINRTGDTGLTNSFITTGHFVAGEGSGAVGLSINDGHGNANLTFNHHEGVPDTTGNSARIEVNVDTTSTANFSFELKSNTQKGVAEALTPVLNINENISLFYTGVTISDNKSLRLNDNSWIYFNRDGADSLRMNHGTQSNAGGASFDFYNQSAGKYAYVRMGSINVSGNADVSGSMNFTDDNVVNRTFDMLDNVGTQYLLLCANTGSNNVSGNIRIVRTSVNWQAASIDIVITSNTSSIQGGSLVAHQEKQSGETYDLVTATYNGTSYVAMKYTGNPYMYTGRVTFTGKMQSTVANFITKTDSEVTAVAALSSGGEFAIKTKELRFNGYDVYHENNIPTWNQNTTGNAASANTASNADNADTLNGKDSSKFGAADNSGKSDPDTYKITSGYRFDPHANNPSSEHYAISTFGNGANVVGQHAIHFITGDAYTRAFPSGNSNVWRKQWNDGNDDALAKLSNDQTFTGDIKFDSGDNTHVKIVCGDNGNADLSLLGTNQGTGRLYVGQSDSHGGGIEYNGDSSPATSGAGSDYITLYRRSASVNYWTARNFVNSNNWEFRNDVEAPSFTGALKGNADTVTNGVYTTGDQAIKGSKSFRATDITGSYHTAAIEMREVNHVTTSESADAFAPAIGFHWGGTTQGRLSLHADGHFYFADGINHTTLKSLHAKFIGDLQGNVTGNAATVNNGVYTFGNQTIGGVKTYDGDGVFRTATKWEVSGSDDAHQRADARTDAGDEARLYWYGKDSAGGTRNFKHAWYDGSSYINVTASSGGKLTFGNDSDTIYIGSNRVYTDAYHPDADTADNAIKLQGLRRSTAAVDNTVVSRDGNADVYARLLRADYQDNNYMEGAIAFRASPDGDNYTRYCDSPAAIRNWLGTEDASLLTTGTIPSNRLPAIIDGNKAFTGNALFESTATFENSVVVEKALLVEEGLGVDGDGYSAISYPEGGGLELGGNTNGAIQVTLPNSWTNTMMKFTVEVYDYYNDESFTAILSGYTYSGSNNWFNPSVQILGSRTDNNTKIRFGHTGTKCCVWIGESAGEDGTNSTWSYLKVIVKDVFVSHSNSNFRTWNTGWNLAMTEAAFPQSDYTYSGVNLVSSKVFADGGNKSSPSITFRNDSNTGFFSKANGSIGVTANGVEQLAITTGPYGLDMQSSIDMNNYGIDDISHLHFKDNVRFYDGGNDSYLNFKYGDGDNGGIRLVNGSNEHKGLLYANNSGFGLLNETDQWAFKCDADHSYMLDNGATKLSTTTIGVFVNGDISLSNYLNVHASKGITSAGWIHLHRYGNNEEVTVGNDGTDVGLRVPNGNTVLRDLKVSKARSIIELDSTSGTEGEGSTLRFNGAGQNVQIRHNLHDSTRPPYGLHIETGEGVSHTQKAYLEVEGVMVSDEVNTNLVELGSMTLKESSHRNGLLRISDTTTSWSGIMIGNDYEDLWSFMSNGDECGLYNDSTNEWHIKSVDNHRTDIYFNNAVKFATTNTGIDVTGNVVATGTVFGDEVTETSALKYKDITHRVSLKDSLSNVIEIGRKGTAIGTLKNDDTKKVHRWFIADEVAEVTPEVVRYVNGEVDGLSYSRMLPDAYAAIAKQQEYIEKLEIRLQRLEALLNG